MSQLKHFLIMWLVVALSACATVDFDYPKVASTVVLNTEYRRYPFWQAARHAA
jgi:hypothetical protein